MRNRESMFWGVILVLLGGLLLMDNMGLLPRGVNVWSLFWPIILIILGVRALLRATSGDSRPFGSDPREFGDTPAAGTTVGGPAVGAPPAGDRAELLRLPLEGARSAMVKIHHGAGELRIDDRAAPGELLNGAFDGGVDHQISRGPEQTVLDLRVPSGVIGPMMPFDSHPLNWTLGFNPEVPLYLDLEVGASRNQLDLRNLQVKDLRLQTGASDTRIEFPQRGGQTRATIKSGAASVEMVIPENVSAWIRTRGGLSSVNVDTARFPQWGSEYRSPDYEIAANKVELDVETGVGSVRIR